MRRESDRVAHVRTDADGAVGSSPATRPIVILGVSRRSGTNHLADVLLCHQDCVAPLAPVAEDHLLVRIGDLERYVRGTSRRWPHRWGNRAAGADRLRGSLGAGLMDFLEPRGDHPPAARVVSRTPSPANLGVAAPYLTGADVILLVRDGRSVTASFAEAWGWPFDLAVREWRRGAREILAARERGDDVHVVRFEDLVGDLDGVVQGLCDFTGLDPDRFDRRAAQALPVRGSSFERDADDRVTWEPQRASAGFDPTVRFTDWPRRLHDRYAWLAGEEHVALGYQLASPRPAGLVARRMSLDDLTSPLRTAPWRLRRSAANAFRTARAEHRARSSGSGGVTGA